MGTVLFATAIALITAALMGVVIMCFLAALIKEMVQLIVC